MDNQALAVLVAVALCGAMAIGIVSTNTVKHENTRSAPQYFHYYDASYDTN